MIRCQLNTYTDTCVIYRNLFPKAVDCHSYDTMHRSPCLRVDLERTCYFLEQSDNLGFSASDFQNNELHQISAVKAHCRHLWIRDWYLGMSSIKEIMNEIFLRKSIVSEEQRAKEIYWSVIRCTKCPWLCTFH